MVVDFVVDVELWKFVEWQIGDEIVGKEDDCVDVVFVVDVVSDDVGFEIV